MKGFYIQITNNLLEPKHKKQINNAVWEFMWCLDKITKIDDDGVGWLLGGKPIQLKDIKLELGTSVIQISRNLNKLLKFNYLILKHTPYGIIIGVKKAQKRFSKNDKPTLSKMINPPIINDKPNKTVSVDTTVRQYKSFSYKKVFNNKEWRAELMRHRKFGEKVIRNKKLIIVKGKKLLLDQNGKWEELKI